MGREKAKAELRVLKQELKEERKKLSSCAKEAKGIILHNIKLIQRDIRRNTAILRESNV